MDENRNQDLNISILQNTVQAYFHVELVFICKSHLSPPFYVIYVSDFFKKLVFQDFPIFWSQSQAHRWKVIQYRRKQFAKALPLFT